VWLECWAGDLERATRAADEAVERLLQLATTNGRALALAARAQVDAYAGRADEARRGAEEALALFEATGWRTASTRPLVTLAFLDLSLGDHEAAALRVGAGALAAAAAGLDEAVPWGGALAHGDAAEALVGVGRIDEAETIVASLEARGAGRDRAWPYAVGARGRGLVLAARGELAGAEEALERALAAHERLPMPIERARSLLTLGRIQRRARKRLAAKATLEEALAVFEAAGSGLWAEQARVELASLGLRPGSSDDLTPSEERVARLAASGLTNQKVAASEQPESHQLR